MSVPKLRFNGFEGRWFEVKGNYLFDSISDKKHNSDLPILAITQDQGAIPRELINYKVIVSDASVDSYKVVNVGDFIISLRSFQGGIEYSNYKGICSPAYIILRNTKEIFGPFYKIYFKTYIYISKLCEKLEGIRDGKMVSYKYFSEISIPYPSLPEQEKIASFFTVIDQKLNLLKEKKEKLELYKKGVMQQIFSEKLRFKDEKGYQFPKWEEKKLGKIAKRIIFKNKEDNQNVLTISAQQGLISQLEYFNKSVSAKNLTNYYLIEKDDFAYNKSYSKGYPMGAIKRLKRYSKGVVSTLYICFRFDANQIDMTFMEQLFEAGMHVRELENITQEGARNHGLLNIGINDFFDILLNIPTLPEQQKIADFLSALDSKINLVSTQIEKTELWKRGLLQQMFI